MELEISEDSDTDSEEEDVLVVGDVQEDDGADEAAECDVVGAKRRWRVMSWWELVSWHRKDVRRESLCMCII